MLTAYADHMINEVLAVTATRSIHWLPAEMSLTSAVAKYAIPLRTDAVIRALDAVFGARCLVAEHKVFARWDKLARDCRLVDLFDGNRVVNLHAIVNQFPLLAAGWRKPVGWEVVEPLFDLSRPVPPFDATALRLTARRGMSVVRAVPAMADRVRHLAAADHGWGWLRERTDALLDTAEDVHRRIAVAPPPRVAAGVECFALAEEFVRVATAGAALGVWLATRNTAVVADVACWRTGGWLRAVLHRLLSPADPLVEIAFGTTAELLTRLVEDHHTGPVFSLLPTRVIGDSPC